MSSKKETYQKFKEEFIGQSDFSDQFISDYVANYLVKGKANPNSLFEQIELNTQKNIIHRPVLLYSSIAAACILIIFCLSFLLESQQTYTTLVGETQFVMLPDSSSVHLNENSKLTFSNTKWAKERMVKLTGEAFFQVKKGSRFDVKTEKATVSVLGTSFTVHSSPDYFQMDCYSGKVKVEDELKNKSAIAIARESLTLKSANLIKKKIDLAKVPEWTNWVFNFKKLPLQEVFQTLENHYKIKLKYSNIPDLYFSGQIQSNKLEDTFEIISASMGCEFQQIDKVIYVKFKMINYEN